MVHEIRHVLFKKLFISSDRISCQWALAFGSPFLNKVQDLILRILQAYCTFLDFFCKTRLTMMLNTPFTHQIQDLKGKQRTYISQIHTIKAKPTVETVKKDDFDMAGGFHTR